MKQGRLSALSREYAPHSRAERLIALGRFILAFFSLVAVYFEPSTPAKYEQITYTLLTGYAVYAFVMMALTWVSPLPSRRLRLATHVADLILFSIFVYLTEGPASPFFLYFVFSLFCAMLRFSWRGILVTGLAALAIYSAVAVAAALTDPQFELSRVVIRAAYLGVIAALLVYLGIYEQRLRAELTDLAAWPHGVRSDLQEVLHTTLDHAASVLRSQRLIVFWEETDEPWLYVAEREGASVLMQRMAPGQVDPIGLPGLPGTTSFMRGERKALVYDPGQSTVSERTGSPLSAAFRSRFRISSAIVVPFAGEAFSGHLVVADVGTATADHLALAHVVGRLVLASMEQFYFLKEVRRNAGAEERLRIARDLHDGIVQSLGGVGLHLQSLRSQVTSPAVADQLARLQQILEHDQRDLRNLVRELRSWDAGNGAAILEDELQRMRERFALEWGLAVDARVSFAGELSPRLAREACRILNESLSNAARHGGASQAEVTIARNDSQLQLIVRDNGRGFPFAGRLDLRTMDRSGQGPRSLRERISILGGTLVVESSPQGALVEANVPLRAEAS